MPKSVTKQFSETISFSDDINLKYEVTLNTDLGICGVEFF